MSYKNTHKTQYVSVPKVLKALETLKRLGNRYYQFVPDIDTFKERCQETDTDGFNFLFQDELDNEKKEDQAMKEDISLDENETTGEDSNESEVEEEEYKTKDSVSEKIAIRLQQINMFQP